MFADLTAPELHFNPAPHHAALTQKFLCFSISNVGNKSWFRNRSEWGCHKTKNKWIKHFTLNWIIKYTFEICLYGAWRTGCGFLFNPLTEQLKGGVGCGGSSVLLGGKSLVVEGWLTYCKAKPWLAAKTSWSVSTSRLWSGDRPVKINVINLSPHQQER